MRSNLKFYRFLNRAKTLCHILKIKALKKKPYPFYVNLVINSQCNLRCAYCFGKYSFRPQRYWSFEKLKLLIDELYKRGTRYILVQGGEPLLHPEIREILKYLIKKKIVCAIVSNGTLPKKIKEIKEIAYLDNICFSLDGNKEGNDLVRGKGVFDKVLSSIEEVRKYYDTPIRINSTIHKYVVNDCDFMAEFVKKNNIEWGVSYLFKGDEKIGEEDLAPTEEEITYYQKELIEYKRKGYPIFTALKILEYALNWPFSYQKIFVNKKEAEEKLGKKAIECQYGRYEIVIDEDGSVYPCNGMQGIFQPKNFYRDGLEKALENLKNKPCYSCYLMSMINTSAMINWDFNVIGDTIFHTLRNWFKIKN
ncbi:MAG: radical SAM protein [Candidatus Paceibacterota bacterium]|jgi:MoaA/NifB/PqqE/SkfB family radical SAM enzyme